MDPRICQTSDASPAEPGGLPIGLEDLWPGTARRAQIRPQ